MAKYQPGVCNIGKNEIRKRYALAAAGFAVSAIFVCLALLYGLPKWALFITFVPLVMGFEGFFQGYLRFCAGFAAAGIYDFAGSGGSRNKVADMESHREDLKKAMKIHAYSVFSSIVVVAVIYLALWAYL